MSLCDPFLWTDSNGHLRRDTVVPIPCRCLFWHHSPKVMPDGRHTTWQILPTCILHRPSLMPEALAWLEAETEKARMYATERRPWQQVLRDRLAALWWPQVPTHSLSEGAHA